ncbi:hypothetical protein VTK56DRAFT_587 [Thermocarpiscus australiensis]
MDKTQHDSWPAWPFEGPFRRLKDSCDMCSASKVRCDRQKPICGRCDRLAYPCFYSPARRVGRPQGRGSGSGQPRNNRRSSAAAIEREAFLAENSQRAVSPPVSGLPRDRPVEAPFALATSESQHRHPEPCLEPISVAFSAAANRDRDGCESDCLEIGMNTQRELESALSKFSPASSSSGVWPHEGVDRAEAAFEVAGTAMRYLSVALICPCSERLEIGVVVGAVCMCILELYNTIASRATMNVPPSIQWASSIMGSLSAFDRASGSMELPWGGFPFSPPDHFARREGQGEQHLMLIDVLGELAKLGTVVYQFTKRYRAGQADPAIADILQLVAALLKSRLKAVGDATTAKLQMAGPRSRDADNNRKRG